MGWSLLPLPFLQTKVGQRRTEEKKIVLAIADICGLITVTLFLSDRDNRELVYLYLSAFYRKNVRERERETDRQTDRDRKRKPQRERGRDGRRETSSITTSSTTCGAWNLPNDVGFQDG